MVSGIFGDQNTPKHKFTVEQLVVRPDQSYALNFQLQSLLKEFDRAYAEHAGPLNTAEHQAEQLRFATFVAHSLVDLWQKDAGNIKTISSDFKHTTSNGTYLRVLARSTFDGSDPTLIPYPA